MVDVQQLQATVAADNALHRGAIHDAPAIAASDTAMPNNTGRNALVRITAGTISAVKVDDVTITGWTTGDWVPVPAGSSLKITYTVAPTSVQWFSV